MDDETETNHRANQMPDLPSLCRSMFEGSPLPMATVEGAKHVVRYVNPAFCRLAGKTKDELIGNPFAEIVPEDGFLSFLDQVYRTGKAGIHTEPETSVIQTAYWSYAMWPVVNADERPAGVMIQVTETARFHRQATAMNEELLLSGLRQHELTEVAEKLNAHLQQEMTARKLTEEALIRSEKLASVGRMAATIAHEINNPLSSALNALFLVRTDPALPECVKSHLTLAEQELGRVAHITKQTLGFFREVGNPTAVDLAEVLDSVLDIYGPRLRNKGITVLRSYRSKTGIRAVDGEMRQVASNILANSFDALSQGGKLHMRLFGPQTIHGARRMVRMTIADDGAGIAAENLERIFEPFFTTKQSIGTGLGLWATSELVKKHGGRMRLRSKLGKGTVVTIWLPMERRGQEQRTA